MAFSSGWLGNKIESDRCLLRVTQHRIKIKQKITPMCRATLWSIWPDMTSKAAADEPQCKGTQQHTSKILIPSRRFRLIQILLVLDEQLVFY